jgi:hypothetical protein
LKWKTSQVLQGHGSGIIAIGALRGRDLFDDEDWMASSSSDGMLKIWKREGNDGSIFLKLIRGARKLNLKLDVVEFQTLQLVTKYAMALAMGYLPNTKSKL